jgi:hypothetical protein
MPAAQKSSAPQPLVSGQFYSILHPTAGTATIYQMEDGTRILRFTGFTTSNGPDVHVYMVASDDAKDVATVQQAGFVDLESFNRELTLWSVQQTGALHHQGERRRPKLHAWWRSGPG